MPIEAKIKSNLARALSGVGERLQARLAANVHVFASAVLEDLIAETPKLSGQAASNWQVTVGAPNSVYIELRPRDVFDAEAVEDALGHGLSVIEQFTIGETLIIFNNAPYIQLLNQGYSRKAPAGFVEEIIGRHRGLLTNAIVETST